jgi:hypothetical protein
MITTATALLFGTPETTWLMPLLSCRPFSPSDVAVPNSVATMASASIVRPSGFALASWPSSGVKAELTSVGSPLRNVKYASAPPMIAYSAQPLNPQCRYVYWRAMWAASSLRGSARPCGGADQCEIGSAVP